MIGVRRWFGSWLAARWCKGKIEEQVFDSQKKALRWVAS